MVHSTPFDKVRRRTRGDGSLEGGIGCDRSIGEAIIVGYKWRIAAVE